MAKYTEFGMKVMIALLERDMSIPNLADEIGTSRQYLADILKGARPGKRLKPIIKEKLGIIE
jgi:predicted DNA-binding protein YlxM (UPF0122 family)